MSTRASSSNLASGSASASGGLSPSREPGSRTGSDRGGTSPIEAVSGALGLVERPDMPAAELSALMSSLGLPASTAPRQRRTEPASSFLADTTLSNVSTLNPGRSLHVGVGREHPYDRLPLRLERLGSETLLRRALTPELPPSPAHQQEVLARTTLPRSSWSFVGRLVTN